MSVSSDGYDEREAMMTSQGDVLVFTKCIIDTAKAIDTVGDEDAVRMLKQYMAFLTTPQPDVGDGLFDFDEQGRVLH